MKNSVLFHKALPHILDRSKEKFAIFLANSEKRWIIYIESIIHKQGEIDAKKSTRIQRT
jgi:hypothetical protein